MIFFDIDGTLLDHKLSEYLGVAAFYKENKEQLKVDEDGFYKLWCEMSDKNFRRYLDGELTFTQQRNERVKEVFASLGIMLTDNQAEKKFQTYLASYENSWKPFDDLLRCIKGLKGFRLGVISNGDYSQQLLKLERMGIKEYFEIIVAAGDLGLAKPDTRIFNIACERARTHPYNCYYVGDDLNTDILSCEKIGMKGIWLNRKKDKPHISDIKMISGLDELIVNICK